MRLVQLVLALGFVLALGACGDRPAVPLPSSSTEDRRPVPGGGEEEREEDDSSTDPRGVMPVEASIVTPEGKPVEGRVVTLVDATGERATETTDAEGHVSFDAVAPPYDLAVAGGSMTMALLGLVRGDPRLEIELAASSNRDGGDREPSQRLRLAVLGANCPRGATLTLVSVSPSGSGVMSRPCRSSEENGSPDDASISIRDDESIVVELAHEWHRPRTKRETISVELLVTDEARATFGHARKPLVRAAPGVVTDLGVLAPEPVPSTESLLLGALSDPYPEWTWSTDVWLDVAPTTNGRVSFVFASGGTSQRLTRLPRIVGWSFRVSVAAVDRRGAVDSDGFHRSVRAWSKAQPLVSSDCEPAPMTDVDVEIEPGPEASHPAVDGSLSRKAWGVEWEQLGHHQAVSTLTLVDLEHGGIRYRVLTDGTSVSFDRLEDLGLPRLALGEHMLDLATSTNGSVDDVASPDRERRERHRESDTSHAGSQMSLRVPFRVTP